MTECNPHCDSRPPHCHVLNLEPQLKAAAKRISPSLFRRPLPLRGRRPVLDRLERGKVAILPIVRTIDPLSEAASLRPRTGVNYLRCGTPAALLTMSMG